MTGFWTGAKRMNITVLGLWHLGSVTAACSAEHHRVAGFDFDETLIASLREGRPPLHEPGLPELLQQGLTRGTLSFSTDPERACTQTDVLWVCDDTPVDDNDCADVDHVIERIRRCLSFVPERAIILISSQLPVGSARRLTELPEFRDNPVAVSPENLRLGQALRAFREPSRVVIGVRDEAAKPVLAELFRPFSTNIIWMSPESAEMTKHALNGFLALSVAYINEIARVCENNGADAKEVERGLKSEPRIGPGARLAPGSAFAGGTLARDVVFLSEQGRRDGLNLVLIPAIKSSNDLHRQWDFERLSSLLGELAGSRICLFGLTYKPATDTLRRSRGVELSQRLHAMGARVRAWDPVVKSLPDSLGYLELCDSPATALQDCDALVIMTEWQEFREYPWADLLGKMRRPLVLDSNRFLSPLPGAEYHGVGGQS